MHKYHGIYIVVISLVISSFSTGSVSAQQDPVAFEKIVLQTEYLCDGAAVGDFNRDGKKDIAAGPYWYAGPDFKQRNEIYEPAKFDLASPTDSLYAFTGDFNDDGWDDVLMLGRCHLHEARWYENPGRDGGLWKRHFVFERIWGESPAFLDLSGNGIREIITHQFESWGTVAPNPSRPTAPWRFRPIEATSGKKVLGGDWPQWYHGTGVGDINGDGRADLVLNHGWAQRVGPPDGWQWKWNRFKFSDSRGGAQMPVYDVDGDGRADIITSLDAHGWGLAWFQQTRDPAGAITFKRHMMMGDRSEEKQYGVAFSQPHAIEIADMNGDGLTDVVVAKRRWAHGPKGDVEPNAPPVVYWFELQRNPKGAKFIPHMVDNESGCGLELVVEDVNADGRPDIVTASKLGVFLFLGKKR